MIYMYLRIKPYGLSRNVGGPCGKTRILINFTSKSAKKNSWNRYSRAKQGMNFISIFQFTQIMTCDTTLIILNASLSSEIQEMNVYMCTCMSTNVYSCED